MGMIVRSGSSVAARVAGGAGAVNRSGAAPTPLVIAFGFAPIPAGRKGDGSLRRRLPTLAGRAAAIPSGAARQPLPPSARIGGKSEGIVNAVEPPRAPDRRRVGRCPPRRAGAGSTMDDAGPRCLSAIERVRHHFGRPVGYPPRHVTTDGLGGRAGTRGRRCLASALFGLPVPRRQAAAPSSLRESIGRVHDFFAFPGYPHGRWGRCRDEFLARTVSHPGRMA